MTFFKPSRYLKNEDDIYSGFGRYSQAVNRLCGLKQNYNCTCEYRERLFKHASYPPIKYFHSTVQPPYRRRSAHRVASHQCPLLLYQAFFILSLFSIVALNPLDFRQRIVRSALLHIFSICRLDSQITFILSPLSVSRNLFDSNNR